MTARQEPPAGSAARTGVIERFPAEALAGVFDVSPAAALAGEALPAMWHWVQLLPAHAESELGVDGHPMSGVPAPPAAGVRRMFAGGRTWHRRALRVGAAASRTTKLISSADKIGRSGPLTFVTVRHEYRQDGEVAIVEEQDIVYRPPAGGAAEKVNKPAPQAAPVDERSHLELDVDPVLLFRFSALTFNAHRIHYDHRYAATEGYADLVIHGPLQVLFAAEVLRRAGVGFLGRQFDYRLLSPAIGPQKLVAVRSTDVNDQNRCGVEVYSPLSGLVARSSLGPPSMTTEI